MRRMAEPDGTAGQTVRPTREAGEPTFAEASARKPRLCHGQTDESMICERCGKAEMYRMHAVWRCPKCGFKTDCCGW